MFEVEQKFRVEETRTIESRLAELGIVWHESIEQVDLYFNHPARDFAMTDEALRLRRVGAMNRITYKGPKLDFATKTRREIELPLADGTELPAEYGELLIALGFRPTRDVAKTRRPGTLHYQNREFEIAIDHLPRLGTFIELETSANEMDLDSARRALGDLARELELTSSERRSYLELLIERDNGLSL